VYDPGDTLDSGGSASGNDPGVTVGEGNGSTNRNNARVPIADALPAARDRAGRAMDSMAIPPSLEALVRAYFENLGTGGPR
jgi:hypothetical protein